MGWPWGADVRGRRNPSPTLLQYTMKAPSVAICCSCIILLIPCHFLSRSRGYQVPELPSWPGAKHNFDSTWVLSPMPHCWNWHIAYALVRLPIDHVTTVGNCPSTKFRNIILATYNSRAMLNHAKSMSIWLPAQILYAMLICAYMCWMLLQQLEVCVVRRAECSANSCCKR